MARFIGAPEDRVGLFRAMGAREIVTGAGILSRQHLAEWVWARVAGDMMDLVSLGAAMYSKRADNGRLLASMVAVGGVTALDIFCAERLSRRYRENPAVRPKRRTSVVRRYITIDQSPEELYAFWRELTNLPQFMENLETVETLGDGRSHWVAKAPAGMRVEWDAEIIEDRPNELIRWRSLPGADVYHSGGVHFQRGTPGRGTIVRVVMNYRPPGGVIGKSLAKLFGKEPGQQIEKDLLRLKQLIETGEIATTQGQPSGGIRQALLGR
jgi:uncharacterized membrane protein